MADDIPFFFSKMAVGHGGFLSVVSVGRASHTTRKPSCPAFLSRGALTNRIYPIINKKMNPSRQYLVGKQRDYQRRLNGFKARWVQNSEKMTVIDSCQSHLDDIECMLNVKCKKIYKKTFTIWHLFHRIDEYFFLLMNEAELKANGWELLQGLKISPVTQQAKTEWIVKLQEMLKKLDVPNPSPRDVSEAAQLFSSAAYIHNDCVDNLFWDYWCRKFFSLIYTIGLLAALIIFVFLYYHTNFLLCSFTAALLGAMGGLLSGIMTTQIESIPYGQFWVSIFYHSMVRPIQGAIAAVIFFWMLQSQYMIKIDPPLSPGKVVFTGSSTCRIEMPAVMSPRSGPAVFRNMSNPKQDPLLVLKAAPGMQLYLYMLVLLIAGFSGDKVLRYVSDKVSGRLFAEAEKTKEAK
ncbi:hypothetical protein [Geotalea sp. SG265]|uniref:hypothetical protein n=1 Tax=Geotalea sp. SG265 TaxID=2922867 RepID=UPI001FAFF6B6|nr:hypothetical protein [Geotalea sp. SG265]